MDNSNKENISQNEVSIQTDNNDFRSSQDSIYTNIMLNIIIADPDEILKGEIYNRSWLVKWLAVIDIVIQLINLGITIASKNVSIVFFIFCFMFSRILWC